MNNVIDLNSRLEAHKLASNVVKKIMKYISDKKTCICDLKLNVELIDGDCHITEEK